MNFLSPNRKTKAMRADAAAKIAQAQREAEEKEIVRKAECQKEIDEVFANILKNQEEYDKQLLTLSAGFLVLSMSFIKDMVPLNQAICREMLYASFSLLAVCIVLVLLSYQVSNQGHFAAKEYWESQKDGDGEEIFPYCYVTIMRILNWSTGSLFCAGVILSVTFVIINIHHEATMTNQSLITVRTSGQNELPIPGAPLKTPGRKTGEPPPPPPPPAKEN